MHALLLLACAVLQEPSPPQADPAVDPAQEAAAARDLAALAERQRDARFLVARYEQRRKTELLPEPLVTRGTLAFRDVLWT